ncbi:unnamed protein product [Closterium sp. Naga37s-1]|nr:unnamed protein product [Closterium sp. Naga37s-1]
MTETEAADAPATVTIAGLNCQLVTFPVDSEALRDGYYQSQVKEGDEGGVEAGSVEGDAESDEEDNSEVPDAHHAAINRKLESELEDLRNTLAVMQYNLTTQQQIELERDELRREVAALRDEILAFRSGAHAMDGPDDVDDPRINMDKLPKVDGKIHVPTSLSDNDAFMVS